VNIRAVAFCVLMLAASPAMAEPWGPYGPRGYAPAVSPYELQATLRAHGLRPITQPVLSGYYLVVRAVDGYGDVVRVLVNARYGNIVSIAPLPPAPVLGERYYRPSEPYRPYQPYPHSGAVRPDLKTEPAPLVGAITGSAAVPNAQQPAMAQPAAVTTTRLPLPRPRPTPPSTTAVVNAAPESASATATPAPATTGSVPSTRSGSSFPPAAPLE
jgi:hypothetical protein